MIDFVMIDVCLLFKGFILDIYIFWKGKMENIMNVISY